MKNKSAITLVALIITIIVLLILAIVGISLVINNGVLDKAQHGVDKYSEEEELEQIKLAVASAMLKGNGFLDTDNLNSELHERIDENENAERNGTNWNYKGYLIDENGNVVKYDKLLPKEYQQVEYIESTGTQYIDTGVKNDINFGYVESKFQITSLTENRYYLFGCFSNSSNNRLQFSFSNPYFIGIGDSNSYTNTLSNTKFSTEVTTVKLSTIQCIVDNEIVYTGSGYSDIPNAINLHIFECNNVNGYPKNPAKDARIYSFNIYNNLNIPVRKFIPCYSTTTVTDADGIQVSANTKGLYDLVEGKFYTNQNTSGDDFNAGPNV